MATLRSSGKILLGGFVLLAAIFTLSCNNTDRTKLDQQEKDRAFKDKKIGMDTAKEGKLSWNVLLQEGSNIPAALGAVEDSLLNQIRKTHPDWSARFDIYYCPCDTLLYNIGIQVLDGASGSVLPPSGVNPPAGGSGDILFASINNQLDQDANELIIRGDTPTVAQVKPVGIDPRNRISVNKKVLAVIDTGIDTVSAYVGSLRQLIWKAPAGQQQLYNFVGGAFTNYFDDHPGKHGTSVATLALNATGNGPYPQIMVLKALNAQKRGSSFTVSCALSYAIKNNANVVNLSLGYYGNNKTADLVLKEYLNRCNRKPERIFVFAAAGNIPGTHNRNQLCTPANPGNEYKTNRMFYPACFSTELSNIISITGLRGTNAACFYQNYSSIYITLGVLNRDGCCKFYVPLLHSAYEGSSYATPVATGMAMSCTLASAAGSVPNCINMIRRTAPSLQGVTKNGDYIFYTGNPPGF